MTPDHQYCHEELPIKACGFVRPAHRTRKSFAFYQPLIAGLGLLTTAAACPLSQQGTVRVAYATVITRARRLSSSLKTPGHFIPPLLLHLAGAIVADSQAWSVMDNSLTRSVFTTGRISLRSTSSFLAAILPCFGRSLSAREGEKGDKRA
jgi:hypothetical protein